MISFSQKFSRFCVIVTLCAASSLVCKAENPAVLEWKASMDPTGTSVEHDLFERPESRGDAKHNHDSGLVELNGGSLVIGLSDEKKFRHLLTKNNELTIAVSVTPSSDDQDGPARILSYSSDHSSRNFTIGQNGNQFDLRLLTEGGDPNGIIEGASFGKIEAGKTYQLIASYKPGHLAVSVNGKILLEEKSIKGGLGNWGAHSLVLGDELNGNRVWRGNVHSVGLYNRSKDLRAKAPEKHKRSDKYAAGLERELAATRDAAADLKKKIAELCEERAKLQLRIEAGDKAGAEIERQLEECLKHHDAGSEELKARLAAAEALAKREHERADIISDAILKQVEAQKQVAQELKEVVGLINQERDELLAKLRAKPKTIVDKEAQKRLIAENEKLSAALKEAWEKAKNQESLKTEQEKAAATIKVQQAKIDALQKEVVGQAKQHEKMKAREAETSALARNLKDAMDGQTKLAQRLDELVKQKAEIEKLADQRRAELEAEKSEREKLEKRLRDIERASRIAEEKEKAAAAKAAMQAEKEANEKAAMEALKKRTAQLREIEIKKLVDIAPIYFGKNQADSEEQEKSLLRQVKAIHAKMPGAKFRITGHTCTDGTPAGNLALSQRRAQRIADLMTDSGIPTANISEVKGLGQTKPQADNAIQQGREANRRVEIEVIR